MWMVNNVNIKIDGLDVGDKLSTIFSCSLQGLFAEDAAAHMNYELHYKVCPVVVSVVSPK